MRQANRVSPWHAVIILVAGVLLSPRVHADACALSDTGRFRVGWELGQQRAGFSGLPFVIVFTSTHDPHWPEIRECLLSEILEPEMEFFTGVLVDIDLEPERAAGYLENGLQGVIRRLSGRIDGFLHEGFTCIDLVRGLQDSRARGPTPEPSPIYALMQRDPSIVGEVIAQDGCAPAARYVSFFEEFEPGESPQVQVAVAILEENCETFLRGDGNEDGQLDISDSITILGHLFLGSPPSVCDDAADTNDDGTLDVSDAIFLLTYLFTCAERVIPPPFPIPGVDSTPDALGCTH